MEVQARKQQGATGNDDGRRPPWWDMLGHLPAVLLLGGLFMYGFLGFCYARFYYSLGIAPEDVGLS